MVQLKGKPPFAFTSRSDSDDSTYVTPGKLRISSRMNVP